MPVVVGEMGGTNVGDDNAWHTAAFKFYRCASQRARPQQHTLQDAAFEFYRCFPRSVPGRSTHSRTRHAESARGQLPAPARSSLPPSARRCDARAWPPRLLACSQGEEHRVLLLLHQPRVGGHRRAGRRRLEDVRTTHATRLLQQRHSVTLPGGRGAVLVA